MRELDFAYEDEEDEDEDCEDDDGDAAMGILGAFGGGSDIKVNVGGVGADEASMIDDGEIDN